jgi:hypothetical protein
VVKDLVDNYSGELDIENFIFVKVDLADLASLEKAFDKVVNKYGTMWVDLAGLRGPLESQN